LTNDVPKLVKLTFRPSQSEKLDFLQGIYGFFKKKRRNFAGGVFRSAFRLDVLVYGETGGATKWFARGEPRLRTAGAAPTRNVAESLRLFRAAHSRSFQAQGDKFYATTLRRSGLQADWRRPASRRRDA
jgi:hypothetical protein